MHVLVAEIDLHIPQAQSLKEKRSSVLSIVRHLDQMVGVGAAEVEHLEVWQRAGLGVSVVGESASYVSSVMDTVERYVWSRPEVDVLSFEQSWWESE